MYKVLSVLFLLFICFGLYSQTDTLPANGTEIRPDSLDGKRKDTQIKKKWEGSADDLLKQAESLYSERNYVGAAEVYEYISAHFGVSDKLYYNLGNAYYKSKNLPSAILNYERALKLNPGDKDVRFNLDMCRARTVDSIEPLGMFMIERWYRSLGNGFDSNTWGRISLTSFLLFITCLFSYFFTRISWVKRVGFFVGLLFISWCILSLIYCGTQYNRIVNPNTAILFSPTVTVKSSPDQSGTDLFIIHEGIKVTVVSTIGAWSEIQLEDGNIGWLESKDIVKI